MTHLTHNVMYQFWENVVNNEITSGDRIMVTHTRREVVLKYIRNL